ncbi:MucBP domain-containing protein [Companilactobacillus sp. HBUAS56275]|uniref:MucBP domain-containing protein n=1 Tax=Candidatus Companilactobacillus pullicola TaxID=2838523 RepID=A0A9D1ZQK6_9LACO|nr:MucBP domain-containing protein [Candidatus Companilactobacillus pullicola]
MDFKKKRLNKALEDKTYRVKLVHSKKGWLTIGLTFVTLFSATMLSQKTVDASAVNNVAVASSSNSTFVQLWSDVTSSNIHKANRGLGNGTAWKTAKAVKGVDGETYLLVGGNEYANANQMDLADETSKQDLTGVVLTNVESKLYTNPLADGGPQLITNRGLGDNTAWKTDTKVVVDGQTYYRVATNEWIKANNVSLTSVSSRSEKTYTKNAPDAESTTTDNGNTNNNNSSNGGSTTTPADPDKEVTITINYFKRSTTTNDTYILKTEKRKVKLNSNITIDAPVFNGYTVVPGEDHWTYKVQFDGEEFNIPYTKDSENNGGSTTTPTNPTDSDKEVTITINYIKRSTTTNDTYVLKTETRKVKLNSSITIDAPKFDGYTVVPSEEHGTYKVLLDGEIFTVPYTKDDADPTGAQSKFVSIHLLDEQGKELVGRWDMAPLGKEKTFTAPTLDGYTPVEASKTIVAKAEGDTDINFTYKKNSTPIDPSAKTANVTLKYVDENGKEIADSKTEKQEVGKELVVLAPKVAGYTLYSNTSDRIIVNEAGNTITFIYKSSEDAKINLPADATANITVMYKDENAIRIAKDKVTTEKVGSTVTAKAIDIPGYKLISIPTTDLLVNPDVGNSTTFTYQKDSSTTPETKTANVTVKYVDDQGKDVADAKTLKDQKVDSTISEDAVKVNGYTADQATKSVKVAADGSSVITFTYKKDAVAPKTATVITKFVDESGKELADAKSDKTEIGKDFTAKAVDVDGYTVKGDATQTATVSGDKTVTFTYTKNAAESSVDTSAAASKIISLLNEYRESKGLKALTTDVNLSNGAVARSITEQGHVNANNDIYAANHDEFKNQSQPDINKYASYDKAENLAVTNGSTADEVAQNAMEQWKNSPAHNEAMLDGTYIAVGVGVQRLNNGMYVAIQDFGGELNMFM